MTNYQSGRYIAQKFSHHINDLLQIIYDGTVEPNKPINDFERGVIAEVKSWVYHSLKTKTFTEILLQKMLKKKNSHLEINSGK